MNVKFLSLRIENFKSIKNMEIEFSDTTKIYGANETGKTTVADALSWVLTGKNSLGESTFNVIPIHSTGISPTVELKLSIESNGTERKPTLTRVQKAKIGRDKNFTGEYATECYVNGVKYTQRDFEKWIADNICDPEIFRLIHDVKYFTENIAVSGRERPWEARRRLLTGLCGLGDDLQIAALSDDFKAVAEKLGEYDTAEQWMLKLKAENAQTQKNLDAAIAKMVAYDEILEANRLETTEGETKLELELKRAELKDKKKTLTNDWQTTFMSRNDELVKLAQKIGNAEAHINGVNLLLEGTEKHIFDEMGKDSVRETCPVCGKKFSQKSIEQAKKRHADTIVELKAQSRALRDELSEVNRERDKLRKEYDDIARSRHEMRKSTETEMDEITAEFEKISAKIRETKEKEENIARIERQKMALQADGDALSKKLSELQRDMDMCKDFLSYKVKTVGEKVNALFDGIEFVMFKQNSTNDDIRECCDIKWHGVDYSGLSYSTKFAVSLNIVMGFQKRYGITIPVIVDNAESIDFGQRYDTQMIFLTKLDEQCPICGAAVGRKQADGRWKCPDCGHVFDKKLVVKH